MVNLPLLERIEISGFEMYPGDSSSTGLKSDFLPGMTIVVGANGLGKTTLVLLLRMLCAGPNRLSVRAGSGFGSGKIDTTPLPKNTFAERVGDRAIDAEAELSMAIGDRRIVVRRSLHNLRLLSLTVDGNPLSVDEAAFEEAVCAASGVANYADWVLVSHHLVFVTEESIPPFWDEDAQRQLIRVLLSSADESRRLLELERTFMEADSDFRNVRFQLGRHVKRMEASAKKVQGVDAILKELDRLEAESTSMDTTISELDGLVTPFEELQADLLRRIENSETEYQLRRDHFESARYAVVEASFPSTDDVARYLRTRLYGQASRCLVCGQTHTDEPEPPSNRCPVCTLPFPDPPESSEDTLAGLEDAVEHARAALDALQSEVVSNSEEYADALSKRAILRAKRNQINAETQAVRSKLPKDADSLERGRSLLVDLEISLDEARSEHAHARTGLEAEYERQNSSVVENEDKVKSVFDVVASAFLVESCELIPRRNSIKIGQEGKKFEVQSFHLNLGSATAVGPARRSAADSVSESQRVYIDIAFRIALTVAWASKGLGSLVVDAPEGALDAVFASNAASLLGSLYDSPTADNRVVVASNLVEGSLLPNLARVGGIDSPSHERLIDLIEVAAPTAAVRQRGDKYRSIRDAALQP